MTKKYFILGGLTATFGLIGFLKDVQVKRNQQKEKELIDYLKDNLRENTNPKLENKKYKSSLFLGSVMREDGYRLTRERTPVSERDASLLREGLERRHIIGFVEIAERQDFYFPSVNGTLTNVDTYLCHPDNPATLQEKIQANLGPKPA